MTIYGNVLKAYRLQHLTEVVDLFSNQQIQLNRAICRTLHVHALKSNIKILKATATPNTALPGPHHSLLPHTHTHMHIHTSLQSKASFNNSFFFFLGFTAYRASDEGKSHIKLIYIQPLKCSSSRYRGFFFSFSGCY